MGMFDEYVPIPTLNCPACGSPLNGWQGKDGPNALMIWQQGTSHPINQRIKDAHNEIEQRQLAEFRLPEKFQIYTSCCGEGFFCRSSMSNNREYLV